MVQSHRSSLKGSHKPFKTKHASKGLLKAQYKGKVEKDNSKGKTIKVVSKFDRKNMANQLKKQKMMNINVERKLFSGSSGAEKIITVLALTNDVSSVDIIEKLLSSCRDESDEQYLFKIPSVNSIRINRFKTNLKVIIPDQDNFISILDACKISDHVILGMSATEEIDPKLGEQIIRAIELQGISSVMGVIPNLVSSYPKRNLQQDVVRSLLSYFQHFFPNEDKLFNLELESDSLNAIRTICQKFPKGVTWRDSRGYLVADSITWESPDNSQSNGHVVVEGTLRGTGFNVNRLVHILGYGDFQVDRIEKLAFDKRRNDVDMDGNTLFDATEQESLEELAPNELSMSDMEDEFDMEDYEDDDEFEMGQESGRRKRIPKGMSEYQSRWYLEDDLEELADELGEDDDDILGADGEEEDEMELENEPMTLTEYQPSEKFVELSAQEEARQLEEYQRRVKDDLEWPDEIEISPSESAIERMKRYRGVKSLANCDWNYDEYDDKRPSDWARLLRISNFKATKNKMSKEYIQSAQVTAGNKIRIYIKAPYYILERIPSATTSPTTIFALLEHEHQLAVCNFSIQTWEDREEPIPSKEALIVQYGARRQVIQPVFSSNSNNSNNVHKFERFLHPGSVSIATCITPVTFTNAPAIFFKQSGESGKIELLGHGTFLNCDHTRVLAKRAVLTGHPFKIHKNVITIRYMFFNSEDVNHFKSIPLFTKSGRSGFIKESLGTHGYFKANFDSKLNPQDVIAMALYKRVWPKNSVMWTG